MVQSSLLDWPTSAAMSMPLVSDGWKTQKRFGESLNLEHLVADKILLLHEVTFY